MRGDRNSGLRKGVLLMRAWRLIVIGLAVLAFAALVFPLVLSQNRLREAHSELVKARKAIIELESALSGSRTNSILPTKPGVNRKQT